MGMTTKKINLSDAQKHNLLDICERFEKEDRVVRDRQIRASKRLKYFWDGWQRIWYSEVAHDWRIWDEQRLDVSDQSYYDKPVNVFKAYLESIIAALSVTVPPIICYPDDADSDLDQSTAKAGKKISDLIYRHNNAPLLWLHALFIFCTEHLLASYNYTDYDDKYGTYEEDETKDFTEIHQVGKCPNCGNVISDVVLHEFTNEEKDKYNPDDDDAALQDLIQNEGQEVCPQCAAQMDPDYQNEPLIVTRIVGRTTKPKARQCVEVYGALYVKVAAYAKCQKDTPYLQFQYESHYSNARAEYPELWDKIGPGRGEAYEPYERWGRVSTQYQGEYPIDNVTCCHTWLRPSAFDSLETKADADELKRKFPNGCKVTRVNGEFARVENESLDDHWTIAHNPLSDYLYNDPLGCVLTSIQELTNDLISLIVQTIEHGIPQTMADPNVLDFEEYRQVETAPGIIFPVKPKTGKAIGDSFYQVKTATLSPEILPFAQEIQNLGQLVSGALPSIFGGQMQQSKTASVYSMSRTQAIQRLQNTWKILTSWWKDIFGKVIPAYIENVQCDEKYVEKTSNGDFINVFVRRAELEGKIGQIELEANENLPITQSQMRDVIMQLMQANNPQLLQLLASPENLPLIYEAIGLTDFFIPGEDDRNLQYEEIRLLLMAQPLQVPTDPNQMAMAAHTPGMQPPPPVQEQPTVAVDPIMDNHAIHFEICKSWAVSEAGRLAKQDNPDGYKNVLLHAQQHFQIMQSQMQPPPMPNGAGNKTLPNMKQNTSAPIQGENNVPTVQ